MREPSTRTTWQHPAAAVAFAALTVAAVTLGTWITGVSPFWSLLLSLAAIGLYAQQRVATAPVRQAARRALILDALRDCPEGVYGLELARMTGLGSGLLYPELTRMEAERLVCAWWGEYPADGGPRRRYYGLAAGVR